MASVAGPLARAGASAGLLLFGILLGLAAIEVTLWAAGPFLRPELRLDRPQASISENGVRVLCVGDSHTYGIWVEPGESYPARLQRRLSELPVPFVVLNAGVPGMNSSQVRKALPGMLESFAPRVVLLMVGVADFWNFADLQAQDLKGWRWLLGGAGLWDRSKTVKLARLIHFNLRYGHAPRTAATPVIEQTPYNWRIRGGSCDIDVDIDSHIEDPLRDKRLVHRILRRDLSLAAAATHASGAVLVLMTYPTDASLYGAVNEVYRDFAGDQGLPLIDLARDLAVSYDSSSQDQVFFPDFHPRARGYELIANAVAKRLRPMIRRRETSPQR